MTDKEKNNYIYFNTEKEINKNENINLSFLNENEEEKFLNYHSNLIINRKNDHIKNKSNKNISKFSINCVSKTSLFNNNSLIKKRFMTPKRIIPDRLIIKIGKNDYEPKRKSIFEISKPFKKVKKISNLELYEKEKENEKLIKLFMNIFDDNINYLKKLETELLTKNKIILKNNKKNKLKKNIFNLHTTNFSNFNKKINIDCQPLKVIKTPIKLITSYNFNNSKTKRSESTNNSSRNNNLNKNDINFNKIRNLKLKYSIPNLRYEIMINKNKMRKIKKICL